MGYLESKEATNVQAGKAAAYDAAMAQKQAEMLKAHGANEAIQGLARLQAEQAYMNTVQPQGNAVVPANVAPSNRQSAYTVDNGAQAGLADEANRRWLAEMQVRKMQGQ